MRFEILAHILAKLSAGFLNVLVAIFLYAFYVVITGATLFAAIWLLTEFIDHG